MKRKFSSMWRVAIALVMVLSLGLVMAAPVSADVSSATVTNAPQTVGTAATYTVAFNTNSTLIGNTGSITITFPATTVVPDGATPYNGNVKVNDTSCGDGKVTGDATARTVVITVPKDIGAGAVTVVIDKLAGVNNPTTVASDWKLTVKTSAEPTEVPSAAYSTVAVVPPTLTVHITSPSDGASVSVGQTFPVKARVINTGPIAATAVQATIEVTGDATAATPLTKPETPITKLAVGGSAEVTWDVTCNGVGAVTIKVTPSGKYDVAGTSTAIPSANLIFDQIGVNQQLAAALKVDAITAPSTVKVGETFTVTATVKNTGGAKAKDVELTIDPGDKAALTGADVGLVKKTKTQIPALAEIASGASVDVPWLLKCTAVGDATITVTPDGKDANTGIKTTGSLTPKTATVTQTEAAVLEVTTLTATPNSVLVGETFDVTATVKNTGASTAEDVALTLSIDARAALKAGEVATKTIGYLAPGAESSKTWTLVCTAAGKSTITVTPAGKDVLTGAAIPAGSLISKSVTVLQSVTTEMIDLVKGWNLISLPLIPTDPSIATVLAGADVTVNKVAYYTGGPEGSWQLYSPPIISLTQMKDGKGYWIDVSANGTLTATGVQLALPGQVPPTYDIVAGWNLIGFTSTVGANAGNYLGPAVVATVEAMYRYDASVGYYKGVLPTEDLIVGSGYWLAVNAAGKIYP